MLPYLKHYQPYPNITHFCNTSVWFRLQSMVAQYRSDIEVDLYNILSLYACNDTSFSGCASLSCMLMFAFDPSKTIKSHRMKKEKLWKRPAVFTYIPPPPHPQLHLKFLSFPSLRWANRWLYPTERRWSRIIPTERFAKANLARGNGDPAPFSTLPIPFLSFSFSVCVCVCSFCVALRQQRKACSTRGAIRSPPSHSSLSLFPCRSLLSCET